MKEDWIKAPRRHVVDFEDDFDDELFDSFDSFDEDLDDDGFDQLLEPNEIRPHVRQASELSHSRTRQSASRLLPHDWADFDYSGTDDNFDSNWR